MKIVNLGDFNLEKDLIKNPKDWVRIDNQFYRKDDKQIVLLSNGVYEILNKKLHTIDELTGNYELKINLLKIKFLDKKGKIVERIISNLHNFLKKDDNWKTIFHDIDPNFVLVNENQLNQFNDNMLMLSTLQENFVYTRSKHDGLNVLIRANQADKLGYVQLLSDPNVFMLKTKYVPANDRPQEGNYIRGVVRKYDKTEKNMDMIAHNNLTFGIEIETNAGSILPSAFKLANLDVTIDRDGSVRGGEYVTGILKKDHGFYDLYKMTSMVSDRCTADVSCGIHVHIGNIFFNKKFTNFAYLLGYKLQDELLSFLHPTRVNNNMCGKLLKKHYDVGKKIYTTYGKRPLSDRFFYAHLYNQMMYDKDFLGVLRNKKAQHPGRRFCGRYQDPFGGNITPDQFRYKWLNLIPTNFNQRGVMINKDGSKYPYDFLTIEFRPYHATLDYQEIEDWVKFCMAFTMYVNNNSYEIVSKKTITVKEVITSIYDEGLYERISSKKKVIGSKNSYPTGMSFTEFLNFRTKKTKKKNVFNNIQRGTQGV